jgi:hypothetical protein
MLSRVAESHYSLELTRAQFVRQIAEYPRELISQLISKLRMEFSNITMADKYEVISKFLKPNEYQKKQNGEVFTPLSLVNEMLDKLPEEVWKNKAYKWLDPAVGIGNFPIVVYERLMSGLEDVIEDRRERSRHILEEMLYAVDICPVNTSIYKLIMGYTKDYRGTNVVTGSALDKETLAGIQFDIVVGNPPYQEPTHGKRTGGYGGTALWEKFVVHSLSVLRKDGYLVYVHPPSWRKPEHKLWNIMTRKELLHLKINNKKEGVKTFGCSTRFDYYILKNGSNDVITQIIDETGNEYKTNLRKWQFLPNYKFDALEQLLGNGQVIYSRSMYGSDKSNVRKEKDEEYKYPCAYAINKNNGVEFWYSNTNDKGHFGVAKVLLSFGEFQYPYNDYQGEFGMCQIVYGIPVKDKEDGDKLVEYVNSDAFKDILKATKWGAFNTDWRMFKYFKDGFWRGDNVLNTP